MQSGRELTLYLDEVPTSLDGLSTESFAQWTVVYNLTDRLIEFGPHGELIGNLAASWERDPERQGHWIFRLRKDRQFHDGSEVTARDVVDSLKLAVTDAVGYGAAGHFFRPEDVWATADGVVVIRAHSDARSVLEQLNMNAFGIRKSGASGPVYSGAWKVADRGAGFLRLSINPKHPSAGSDCYDSVVIRQVPSKIKDVAGVLAGRDQAVLGRNGLLFSSENLPRDARMFSLASGNSHILSLRPETPHLDYIRSVVHDIMFSGNVLRKLSHARPLNSFFPPGFVVNAPVLPRKPRRPDQPLSLVISVSPAMAGASWLQALKRELLEYGISAEFPVADTWGMLGPRGEDRRDGFIAACYLDIQDPVRLAGHYFSGPRRAVWTLPTGLAEKLAAASTCEPGLERDQLIRAFYEGVIRETPCLPLFFAPKVVLASSDVSFADLEYYGNTFKFASVKKGQHPERSAEIAGVDLRMFAHDVKRPFSLIKAASQLIEAAVSIEDVRKISENLLPHMMKAVASVDGMVKGLLNSGATVDGETSSLNAAITAAIEQVAASYRIASGAGRSCAVEFQSIRPDIHVQGDSASTERIFANLIHNALEAAPPGARVWVRISGSLAGKDVVIGVGNEGSYISPEIQQRLFQVGFSQKGNGRGLGLSIVQNLVQKVGGSISVNSSRDTGTEFLVVLPVRSEARETVERMPDDDCAGAANHWRAVILIEDDPFIADAWSVVWQGHDLTVFQSPEEAFEACQDGVLEVNPATVILTDYLFQGSTFTGRDVVDWARARQAGTIILASDYDDQEISAKVDFVIGKEPLAPEQLFRRIIRK